MTQTVILAPGKGKATSVDVVVPDRGAASIGLFMEDGPIPADCRLMIYKATPGADREVLALSRGHAGLLLQGPNTYRVVREAGDYMVGAYVTMHGPG